MIVTEGLTKRFGATVALDGLDLVVPAGELFCFLGPNGAGKTTTVKLLAGLLAPSSGRVLLGGHDVARAPEAAKALLGYIPDQPVLYDALTARETLLLVAALYRLEQRHLGDRIEAVLGEFGVAEVADRPCRDLSHGMRQKLAFAATFLHAPRVLVVDEPWVGLDPASVRRIKRHLARETAHGLTVFMSTHSLAIAEELADRVGIIHRGRLAHLGTVAEIKALASRPSNLEEVFLELTGEG